MKLIDAFFELLYPPRCLVCDEPTIEYGCCDDCKDKINTISNDMCLYCGNESKFCECNKIVYHFDGITAPYFNEGYAQQTVYDLKFNRKFNCLKPFGKVDKARFVPEVLNNLNVAEAFAFKEFLYSRTIRLVDFAVALTPCAK